MRNCHEKINYVEWPCSDLEASQRFFERVFSWSFEAFGSDYLAFHGAGLDGGLFRSKQRVSTTKGSVLIVFLSENLETTQKKIKEAGGVICQEILSFPGGRRFHFLDPSQNEFAVWSKTERFD